MKIPADNQTVMPYLIISNAAGFMAFAQKVFEAKEIRKTLNENSTIMHGEIMIGDSTIMFADSSDAYDTSPAGLFVYTKDADISYQKALDAGATVITALSNQSYGRSGGVKDPFGNTWWITSVK